MLTFLSKHNANFVTAVLGFLLLLIYLVPACSRGNGQSDSSFTNTSEGGTSETEYIDGKESESSPGNGIETNLSTDKDSETDSESLSESVIGTGSNSDSSSQYGEGSDTTGESETDSGIGQCVHPKVEENCIDGWCTIPKGCFVYGAPSDEPCGVTDLERLTEVTLSRDFVIAQTEVTQSQWEDLMSTTPWTSDPDPPCANCPVSIINWYEPLAYCNALSDREGLEPCYDLSRCEGVAGQGCPRDDVPCDSYAYKCEYQVQRFQNHYECSGYRLPTSAEWQYAARAGTTTATYNGDLPGDFDKCVPQDVLDPIAWFCGNTEKAMPVAQKQPNAWGLYDMLGNIYEWVSDNYDGYSIGHGEERVTDPQGVKTSSWSMRNGGSWWSDCYVRAGAVIGAAKNYRSRENGFRPVRTLTFSGNETDTDTAVDSENDSEGSPDTDTMSDPLPDTATDVQCIGQSDFFHCNVDTTATYGVDYNNDICIDEICVSVGICNDRPCNVPGPHFVTPPVTGSERLTRTEPVTGQAIVTDNVTGLVWQGTLPTVFDVCTSGYPAEEGTQCTWWEAFAYCDGLDWGGYGDWYLPDEHELISVLDYGAADPALDGSLFPSVPVDLFWTSSSFNKEEAWFVSMDMGRLDYRYKDFGAFVWCVRRESEGLPERFVRTEPFAGEPVVTDQVTGLVWQGCAAGQVGGDIECIGTETFYSGSDSADSAAVYCESLDWGGHTDWRLPHIKELASLMNSRTSTGVSIDPALFPDTPATWFWTATQYVAYPDHTWFLGFGDGHINVADQTYGHAVRCVR